MERRLEFRDELILPTEYGARYLQRRTEWRTLAILFAMTSAAALVGSLGSRDAQAFYEVLDKPVWAPAPWVFAPAWGVLYALMAIAAWQGVRKAGWSKARVFVATYVAQLIANALWNPLFFGVKWGAAAMVDAILLLLLVVTSMVALHRLRPSAGRMFLPYVAWVAYATCLTYAVWQRNPAQL